MSMSPNAEVAAANMQHQYNGNSSLPAHMRNDLHTSSPTPVTTAATYSNNVRPTSHPTPFGAGPPPTTLEPSIENSQGPGSAVGSPHMSSVGWASPAHVASPSHSNSGGNSSYVYPDPESYPNPAANGQMFYASAMGLQRPGSVEPGSQQAYKPRQQGEQVWA